jgi:hypothetical protein
VAVWPTILVFGVVATEPLGAAGDPAIASAFGSTWGDAGDSAGDWVSGSAGPVDGSVTFHLIGGAGTDPDRRRGGAAGHRDGCDG